MAIWDDVLTERDKEIMNQAGYGERIGLGAHPAILVIDMTYNFVGDRPEPILKSIEKFRQSCGEEGWAAMYKFAISSRLRGQNKSRFFTRERWMQIPTRSKEVQMAKIAAPKTISLRDGSSEIKSSRNSRQGTAMLCCRNPTAAPFLERPS